MQSIAVVLFLMTGSASSTWNCENVYGVEYTYCMSKRLKTIERRVNTLGNISNKTLEHFKESASDVCSIHFDLGGTGASARFSNCLYQIYDAVLRDLEKLTK